jgi:hypothetical protein
MGVLRRNWSRKGWRRFIHTIPTETKSLRLCVSSQHHPSHGNGQGLPGSKWLDLVSTTCVVKTSL